MATCCLLAGAVFPPAAAFGHSDIAPAPRRAPRTPVHQQVLPGTKAPAAPASRFIEGPAVALDNDRLRIGDVDMRLFGIVPPQLSAPFGPQARTLLDALTGASTVSCAIRDRDHDGRFLALCHSAANADFALELLRRGLAVTARTVLRNADLLKPYIAAEQAAQNQKLGLWSVRLPQAVSDAALRQAAADKDKADKDKEAALKNEAVSPAEPKADSKIEPKVEPLPGPKTESSKTESPVALPAAALKPNAGTKLSDETKQQIPTLADALQAEIADALDQELVATPLADKSLWQRYQFLLGSFFLALACLMLAGARLWLSYKARRAAWRDVADALTGELLAVRATCQNRLVQMAASNGEKAAGWPRLRAVVFQAYAGKLGLLGATLSRQIGAIYGQASDYAAYFNPTAPNDSPRNDQAAKKQALETIVSHIDAVLPFLTTASTSKQRPQKSGLSFFFAHVRQGVGRGLKQVLVKSAILLRRGFAVACDHAQLAFARAVQANKLAEPVPEPQPTVLALVPDTVVIPVKVSPAEQPLSAPPALADTAPAASEPTPPIDAKRSDGDTTPDTARADQTEPPLPQERVSDSRAKGELPSGGDASAAKPQSSAKPSIAPSTKKTPNKAKVRDKALRSTSPLWDKLRDITASHDSPGSSFTDLDDGFYASYTGMTSEEMEELAFGDGSLEESSAAQPTARSKTKRRSGRR